ncbi:unnamed protein product [Amoebophrya sp. A120]|nr:unnamed protein product [Amoebophrya sp. A120]|eukprot:GSA120T00008083001.1
MTTGRSVAAGHAASVVPPEQVVGAAAGARRDLLGDVGLLPAVVPLADADPDAVKRRKLQESNEENSNQGVDAVTRGPTTGDETETRVRETTNAARPEGGSCAGEVVENGKINGSRRTTSAGAAVEIFVSSRKSVLALYQTNAVIAMLTRALDTGKLLYHDLSQQQYKFTLLETSTVGDQVQNRHLADMGSVGVFTKELELQLLAKECRFAVHSLKDMPTVLPEGLMLGCITERGDPRDCVVLHPRYRGKNITSFTQLPETATIGSSSVRREALVLKQCPKMKIENIRGNLQTRLRKLEAEDSIYDAIILAKVGLERLGLFSEDKGFVLEEDQFPYAVSQGAYGVECRCDDAEMLKLLKKIEHLPSAIRCTAERSLLNALDGGCQISMGVRTCFVPDKNSAAAAPVKDDVLQELERPSSGTGTASAFTTISSTEAGTGSSNATTSANKIPDMIGDTLSKASLQTSSTGISSSSSSDELDVAMRSACSTSSVASSPEKLATVVNMVVQPTPGGEAAGGSSTSFPFPPGAAPARTAAVSTSKSASATIGIGSSKKPFVSGTLHMLAEVLSRNGQDSVHASAFFPDIDSLEKAADCGILLADRLRVLGVARIWGPAGNCGKKRAITYGSAETAGIPCEGFGEVVPDQGGCAPEPGGVAAAAY